MPTSEQKKTSSPSIATKQTNSLKFRSPLELVAFVDDEILDGSMKLHKWQAQIMVDFANPTTDQDPYRSVVRAANGSGKDKYITVSYTHLTLTTNREV